MTSIILLITGLGLGALIFWLRSRSINLTWYEWLIGAIGLLIFLFSTINFFGSLREAESTAATMFLLVFGLPAVILMVVSWQLAARRMRVG